MEPNRDFYKKSNQIHFLLLTANYTSFETSVYIFAWELICYQLSMLMDGPLVNNWSCHVETLPYSAFREQSIQRPTLLFKEVYFSNLLDSSFFHRWQSAKNSHTFQLEIFNFTFQIGFFTFPFQIEIPESIRQFLSTAWRSRSRFNTNIFIETRNIYFNNYASLPSLLVY